MKKAIKKIVSNFVGRVKKELAPRIGSSWSKIRSDAVPIWLEKAVGRYELAFMRKYGHGPWNTMKYFKGKTFMYQVEFRTFEQGTINYIFFRKKRKK